MSAFTRTLAPVDDPVVVVRDLKKTFGLGTTLVHALRGIDLKLGRGELTAIMGPSGSGKSTLMHCIAGLEGAGVAVRSRLKISPACPLVPPCHVALHQAREGAMGDAKIGTTGRGIGPAYEDKIARRAIRLQDLFYPDRFAAKLEPLLEFHNFVLTQYFKRDPVPFARGRAMAEIARLSRLTRQGARPCRAHRSMRNSGPVRPGSGQP